jgi:TolA-binding protein
MKTIDFSHFIERFNAGEMSDSEKQWFLKELDGNEKLRNEVNLRKQTDEILKNQNITSLKSKLSEIERRRAVQTPARNFVRAGYMKYAAVALVLILIGIATFPGKNLSNEEIINNYSKLYQPPTGQRSVQAVTDADYSLAMEFYNIHDYKKAAVLFSKVVENNPKDMQSTFLSGISNYENSKYPEAKHSFGIVISNTNNLFIDQAEWYLAFCYLRTNEREKAIQQFEAIKQENNIYSKEAKRILRKMN